VRAKTRRSGSYRARTRAYRQPSLYSRTEEQAKEHHTRRWPLVLLIILSLSGLAYLVFISGVFSVDQVDFSSTKFIDRGALASKVKENKTFLDNNIITFGLLGLSGRLEQVTGVQKASIKRQSQHHIYVEVEEKAPLFVWQSGGSKYLVDEDGYVWANFEPKYTSLPVIVDTKNVPVVINDKVANANFIKFFQDLTSNFTTTTNSKIAKYEVLDTSSDIKVSTSDGWYVYFDTNHLAKSQLTNLGRVLAQVQNSKQKLEYVDLRIENRIFYK
jgi:cell division septal protein FtsQ